MEKNALHIWPRKSFMMIALPNPDGSFTCTLFWEFEGPRSFATTKTDDEIRRFFEDEFPDAVPLMPSLLDDFKTNPTGSLVTIRCAPWFLKNQVALPLYAMVTFSRISYAVAARRAKLQDRIVYGALILAIALMLVLFAAALR